MREILFRGKIKEDVCPANIGKWVDGELSKDYDDDCRERYWIGDCRQAWIVEEETVGQYTGWDDRNGIKIFEGDIVRVYEDRSSPVWLADRKTIWDDYSCAFVLRPLDDGIDRIGAVSSREIEVIGNIYDGVEAES